MVCQNPFHTRFITSQNYEAVNVLINAFICHMFVLSQTPVIRDPHSRGLLMKTGRIRFYVDIMHIAVRRSFNEISYRTNYGVDTFGVVGRDFERPYLSISLIFTFL